LVKIVGFIYLEFVYIQLIHSNSVNNIYPFPHILHCDQFSPPPLIFILCE